MAGGAVSVRVVLVAVAAGLRCEGVRRRLAASTLSPAFFCLLFPDDLLRWRSSYIPFSAGERGSMPPISDGVGAPFGGSRSEERSRSSSQLPGRDIGDVAARAEESKRSAEAEEVGMDP